MMLTKPQKQIYNMESLINDSVSCICGSMLLKTEKTVSEMQEAVKTIYRINDALRIRIKKDGENVTQFITDFEEIFVPVLYFDNTAELYAYADNYAKIPIHLNNRLWEITVLKLPDYSGILVKFHHIIADSWTAALICSQFKMLINGILPDAYSYADYLVTENEYINSKRYLKDKHYFTEKISEFSEPVFISSKSDTSFNAQRKSFRIDETDKIKTFIEKYNISVFTFILSTVSFYFSRTKENADRFFIGTTILNRTGEKERNTVGMYVNTVPVLIEPDYSSTVYDNISAVSSEVLSVLRHQKFNYTDILEESGIGKLFDILVDYQNATIFDGDVLSKWHHNGIQAESLQVHIEDRDSVGTLKIHYDYRTDKFTEDEINTLHSHIFNLLNDCMANPDKKIGELNMLSGEEKIAFSSFNNTPHTYDIPGNSTLYSLFEKTAKENKDKICIKTAERNMTFGKFLAVSENLDCEIRKITDGTKGVVAVISERSPEMYTAIYGIIRGGNAYLPIDPTYPADRIEYILRNSNASAVIAQGKFTHLAGNVPCIDMTSFIDNTEKSDSVPPCNADENDTAYVIYTSGSTGNPKGAKVSHKSAVNRILWMHDKYPLCADDVILQKTPYTFDVSVWELFWWGMVGGCLAVSRPDEHFIPEKILAETQKNNVTHIHFVPSVFELFLSYLESHRDEISKFNSVKYVFLSGEALSASLVQRFYKLYDCNKVTLHNLYGPTECAVDVTYYDCSPSDTDPVPIGKPIYNTQMYVVDKYMNLVPVGVQGELCICGMNVGQGYLNNETLTNEKFIDNPFGEGKLYKTGDKAYLREDGEIIFCGRNDFQVKIHGQRIELGEIENAVSSVDGIIMSVAVVREDKQGRQFICVFYTGEEKSSKEIKTVISDKLPKYMIPNVFVYLHAMPLTSSGKINRKALPEVDLENIITDTEYVAPETEKEKLLAGCIGDVLGNEKVSMLDNFFDIGGDSLKAIELSAKLDSEGYEISVRDIFESKNIRAVAEKLTENKSEYVKVEYGSIIPATQAQMRVYTSQYMKPDSAHYNIPYAIKVDSLDVLKLENAVNALISRHESLRRRFENRNGQIFAIIEDNASTSINKLASDDISLFNTPFDLEKAPLIKVGYYGNTIFIITHHIIADGETMNILIKELNELYMGRELPETVQYGEFAVTDGYTKENENYWMDIFSDEIESINLRTDYPRPETRTFRGSEIYELIESHNKISEQCKKLGITPYVYYMACYSILLSKYSGNEDIITSMPVSGREGRFIDTVGMFVNTVALRTNPEGNKTINEFFKEVKESSIKAIDNQNYPFGELVKKLGLNNSSHNPLADIMFAYQSEETTDIIFGDSQAEILPVPLAGVKCDLNFTVMPRENDAVLMAEYSSDLFKESTVKEFISSYKAILESALDKTECIKDISVLSETEKHKILYEFNDTAVEYSTDTCIYNLFEKQAKKNPDKTAVIFKDTHLTYQELYTSAEDYAGKLISLGIKENDTVAIHLERSHRLVILQLAVLKIGAVFLPLDKRYPEERISHACKDCDVKLLITDENVRPDTKVIDINDFETVKSEKAETVVNNGSCYIIYTSGSTGKPKGCLLTGKGLINFCKNNNTLETLENIADCTFACVNAVSFDYFIAESLLPLTNGFTTVILDDGESTIQNKFTAVAEKNNINVLMTTPTRLKIYFDNTGSTAVLKNLKCICTSGEPLTAELLSTMYEKSPEAKVYNPIGPSECSVWDMGGELSREDGIDIHIGKPIANARIYITDKYMNPVPVGVTGEICIAGDGVGNGYINNPELTAEKFIDNPFGDGKLYKSGDLGYWREDGNIVFVGRNDFQVKIRGLRIELGEIENAVSEVKGINLSVAVVREDKEGRQFICVFYTGEEKPAKEIRSVIADKLPGYMIPNVFVYLNEMPLTSSGKINRKALPEVDLENIITDTEYVAPETEKEKLIAKCIGDVLGNEKVSMLDNFFDIGGDSLKAIELSAKLDSEGYGITVRDIFESKNIRAVAEKLTENKSEYVKVEYGSIIPATQAQMRVYTAQQMYPDSTLYNITNAFRTENVDKTRLESAINKLIARHESLRTRFENTDGRIYQVIEEKATVSVEEVGNPDDFAKPFDLSVSPLIRVGCNNNTIVVDIHHIITDGESLSVFWRELNELYMGRNLPDTVQYGEFAVNDGYTKENENYWLDVFDEEVPELTLPFDFARSVSQSSDGSIYYNLIEKSIHDKIEEKCRQKGITPYVYYMACFSILLSKLSGNEDIVVGTPVSGREGRFIDTVGMFVNTIAMRTKPDGNKTVSEFLNEVRECSVKAIDNRNYPFGELVKKLGIESVGRNPLFDTMLAYQSQEMTDIIFADRKAEILPLPIKSAKCDMMFNILPGNNDVVIAAEYSTELFREEKIVEFTRMFKNILEICLEDNNFIRDISVLSEDEKNRILYDFNNTAVEYSTDTCIYNLFEGQAKKNPDKTAVIFKDTHLTYQELYASAEDYAGKLISLGIKENDTVAIHLERSHRLVILQLAVLKIGAVFLPLDKRYPEERISHACKDCDVKLLITDENVRPDTKVIDINDFETVKLEKAETVVNNGSCYIIYTSGSTGKPKGCLLTGKGLLNFCKNNNTLETLRNIEDCVFACVNAVSFDYFIAESLLPLTNGFTTVILDDCESTIQNEFTAVAEKNNINVLMTTPTRLKIYFDNTGSTDVLKNLKCICTSGEPLTAELLTQMYEKSPDASVYNPIGPSECSVWDMGGELSREDGIDIHIGKPIANARIYITDKYMNPVPVGVTGEICIAGDGVGNGYINNPELTAEKFIDNPFGDGKLYKSGDLGYWREDGNIVFVGRNDFQVKIRGLRIELGEIENAVSEVKGINLSVAVVREDKEGRQFICVFYTGAEKSAKEIRSVISDRLPAYMIPNVFTHLSEMPLTSSGKINRKALPEEVIFTDNSDIEPPENETEKFICDIFSRILGVSGIGRNSDFFEMGGTSLSMISLLSEKAFDNITAAEFMRNATPAKLSALMTGRNISKPDYLEQIYVTDKSGKALILTPYGGGGAEAYTAFATEFRKIHDDVSLYFVRFLHSDKDCENAASEIENVLSGCELSFCSHCAGAAVTLKIIEKLEKDNFEVKNYFAAAIIPPEVREKKNSWRNVPDFVLSRVLDKSGAKLNELSKETRKRILMRFRKDTDYSTRVFFEFSGRIKTPVTVIISKDDFFTRNFADALKCWSNYAENVKDVRFIDSHSHYFQNENAEEFVKLTDI